jgi:ABC-type amino acid transport substrate-binding protein
MSSTAALAADVPVQLKACADANDFAPYTFQMPDGQVAGFNVDLLAAAACR